MKRHTDPDVSAEGEHPDEKLVFVLPLFVSGMGYSCAREWAETSMRHCCGCPRCLAKNGLVLVYDANDYRESRDCEEQWRKRIVSMRTAQLAQHLICPGYE